MIQRARVNQHPPVHQPQNPISANKRSHAHWCHPRLTFLMHWLVLVPIITSAPTTEHRPQNSISAPTTEHRAQNPISAPTTEHRPQNPISAPTTEHRPQSEPAPTTGSLCHPRLTFFVCPFSAHSQPWSQFFFTTLFSPRPPHPVSVFFAFETLPTHPPTTPHCPPPTY